MSKGVKMANTGTRINGPTRPYEAITDEQRDRIFVHLNPALDGEFNDNADFWDALAKALGTEFYTADFMPSPPNPQPAVNPDYVDHLKQLAGNLKPQEGFDDLPDGEPINFTNESTQTVYSVCKDEIQIKPANGALPTVKDVFDGMLLTSRDVDMVGPAIEIYSDYANEGANIYNRALYELSIQRINAMRAPITITVTNPLTQTLENEQFINAAVADFNAEYPPLAQQQPAQNGQNQSGQNSGTRVPLQNAASPDAGNGRRQQQGQTDATQGDADTEVSAEAPKYVLPEGEEWLDVSAFLERGRQDAAAVSNESPLREKLNSKMSRRAVKNKLKTPSPEDKLTEEKVTHDATTSTTDDISAAQAALDELNTDQSYDPGEAHAFLDNESDDTPIDASGQNSSREERDALIAIRDEVTEVLQKRLEEIQATEAKVMDAITELKALEEKSLENVAAREQESLKTIAAREQESLKTIAAREQESLETIAAEKADVDVTIDALAEVGAEAKQALSDLEQVKAIAAEQGVAGEDADSQEAPETQIDATQETTTADEVAETSVSDKPVIASDDADTQETAETQAGTTQETADNNASEEKTATVVIKDEEMSVEQQQQLARDYIVAAIDENKLRAEENETEVRAELRIRAKSEYGEAFLRMALDEIKIELSEQEPNYQLPSEITMPTICSKARGDWNSVAGGADEATVDGHKDPKVVPILRNSAQASSGVRAAPEPDQPA